MAIVEQTKPKRVSRKSSLKQVEANLRERVACGVWVAGSIVPSRRELAAEFDVDLNTIQRALAPLLSDGTLRAEEGRGTFVADGVRLSAGSMRSNGSSTLPLTIGVTAFLDEDSTAAGLEPPATLTVLKALEKYAAASGSRTEFVNRWRGTDPELSPADGARQLLANGADCVVVVDVYAHPYVLAELRSMVNVASLPIVYLSSVDHHVPCAHVCYDNRDAGFKAAQALLAEGYREITYLSPYMGKWTTSRAEGVHVACDTAGRDCSYHLFPVDRHEIVDSPAGRARAVECVAELIGAGLLRGGIVAAHDYLSAILLDGARRHGLVAGRDFGLVGFDDEPVAYTSGLTTVRPPLEDMAAEAVKLSTRCLEDGTWKRVSILRGDVVLRNSHRGN
ncbi:MAG TPA: GntR family transcriptional regulator [Capsulimonadaceae bacterium]|jgi:DNA-binding LacI/PurR family transcriptional regulator